MGKNNIYYKITRSDDPLIVGFLQHYSMPQVEILPPHNTHSYINAVKTSERVKEVDFLLPKNSIKDLNYIFSKKLLDIIEKYKLLEYKKIKIKIKGFINEYYLVSFLTINPENFNFKKSIFIDYNRKNEEKIFNDFKEYNNYDSYLEGLLDYKKIVLSEKAESDVLEISGALYFSENVVTEIEKMNVKVIVVNKKSTLEY